MWESVSVIFCQVGESEESVDVERDVPDSVSMLWECACGRVLPVPRKPRVGSLSETSAASRLGAASAQVAEREARDCKKGATGEGGF